MRYLLVSVTAVLGLILSSCQSGIWKIEGECDMQDGDTLFITSDFDTGIPFDTTVVKKGKFVFRGDEDTLLFSMVYSPQDNSLYCPVFVEKGVVTMKLSTDSPQDSRVGGTPANIKWQTLTDSLDADGRSRAGLTSEIVVRHTEANINSEYGCFLLSYFGEIGIINPEARIILICKLPKAMQGREAIKQLRARTEQELRVVEGAVIPDFEMNNIHNQPTSILEEIKGKKITIIDFWASWCSPCRAEMPRLVELYAKYASKGLGIVGISLDRDRKAWKDETARQGITWSQMSDLQGWDNAAAQMFSVHAIPYTIVVDENGRILRNGLRGKELEEYIETYLTE